MTARGEKGRGGEEENSEGSGVYLFMSFFVFFLSDETASKLKLGVDFTNFQTQLV